jgi:hypothetical protein
MASCCRWRGDAEIAELITQRTTGERRGRREQRLSLRSLRSLLSLRDQFNEPRAQFNDAGDQFSNAGSTQKFVQPLRHERVVGQVRILR